MSIEFKEGAVCYADGREWFDCDENHLASTSNTSLFYKSLVNFSEFQLNAIKQGDYIAATELDTEKKYNDAVEVFGLFGFKFGRDAATEFNRLYPHDYLTCCGGGGLWQICSIKQNKRELTFNQLMAIGKLKRMIIERENAAIQYPQTPALEVPSKTNGEFPQVGDEAVTRGGTLVDILAIHGSKVWARQKDKPHIYNTIFISNLSKPKSKEDLLIEELQDKLDKLIGGGNSWFLADRIINGDIEGLSYKSNGGSN